MSRKMTVLTFMTSPTQSLFYCYVNLCCHTTAAAVAKIAEARMTAMHWHMICFA